VRAVVQRVASATVEVDGEEVGTIGPGVLAYVGVGEGDTVKDAEYLARKVVGLRVFPDARKPMNRSVLDEGRSVLVVSQFTLYGDCRRGLRPSFNAAMAPEAASELIDLFQRAVEGQGVGTASGRFQAMMEVKSINSGPVTVLLDSKKDF